MITCFCDLPKSVQEELVCIADTLITPGKGILTADESISTMGKRLQEIGLQNSEEIRRKWRQVSLQTFHFWNFISINKKCRNGSIRNNIVMIEYNNSKCRF